MSGFLTTHVLDTARGRPAAGVAVELARLDGRARIPICAVTTNADGRTDAPLVAPGELVAGAYELLFAVGDYFGERTFLDRVPVRFTITDPAAHYHVPLLVSPWSYSTYRGS
jgi:5-hydroxyisourate hydrolase